MQIKNLYGHKQLIFLQNFGHNFLFIRNLNLKYSPFLLEFEIFNGHANSLLLLLLLLLFENFVSIIVSYSKINQLHFLRFV